MRDMAAGLVPLQWQIVFTDEAHKHSNRKTKIAKALLSLKSPWFVICTGSPLKKGNTDLWFLLHLLDRRRWSSYWKYVTMWNHTEKGLYGGMEILAPKDVNAWQKAVSKYFIRRTKAQVRADMPPKIRQRDVVRPSATQQRLIRELAADNLSELQDALVVAPTVLARLTRMRQLLVSPRLLHPEAEWGAAIEALVAKLEDATDRHMAVFTPFAGAIPIVMDRLMAEGYPARSLVGLRGGLKGDDLGAAIQRFRETKGIAIVSIRFAESFDLTPANWGYFLGADWDPETNKQAEDRLHRGLIQDPVNILYAFHPHTTDEDVWAVLDSKTNITNASLQNLSTVRDAMMRILKAPENF
jgi:SNF2 family DNA or RNA helicase